MKPRGKQSGFIQVAQDAEISLLSDRLKLVGFLRARGRPASSARGTSSIANVALDTLEGPNVCLGRTNGEYPHVQSRLTSEGCRRGQEHFKEGVCASRSLTVNPILHE